MSKGQVLALVGESGSGKTTIGRILTGIERPTFGRVQFHYQAQADQETIRGRRRVQMVFQDPYAALNSFNSVEYILARPIVNSQRLTQNEAIKRVPELLETVQLQPPGLYLAKRPYELSGGQRQRVVIARALAASPQIIVADEPVSMLDVSIRAEILKLLHELLKSGRIDTMLYITHDLLSAKVLAEHVIVLYRGTIVEKGPTRLILRHPEHPYTKLLLASIPNPHENGVSRVPDPAMTATFDAPSGHGCPYATRCPLAMDRCDTEVPELMERNDGHWVACHAVV
jgi:peptide/nickel transport system ATP-binding protein